MISSTTACPRDDIAAYLDGELGASALTSFEEHVARCAECATELRTQRQLLCTLEAAFSNSGKIDLPVNFTRIVAAHAENDMRGLRHKAEWRRSLQLCAMLAVAAFTLLGATSGALIFQPVRGFLRLVARVLEVLWQTVADAAEGATIIARMIDRAGSSPHVFGVFLAFVFVVAISLLPRLIANYHRTEFIE